MFVLTILFLAGKLIGQSPEVMMQEIREHDKRLGGIEATAAANQVRIQMMQDDLRDVKYGLGTLGTMMLAGLFGEVIKIFRPKKSGGGE